jgi:xanthine dehydrogenase molybdenum-binding subunit
MRPGFQARVKIGFRKDGRITAMDLFIVEDSGPYERQGDNEVAALIASLLYQPMALRLRGVSVATNTPPRIAQRGPGGMQAMSMIEPLMSRAARHLGVDEVAIRKINAPSDGSLFGILDTKEQPRQRVATARVREALDRGAELFNWTERQKRNGQRHGSKVTGVSAIVGAFISGFAGFDGLLVIKPDGKVYVHQGIGNLGTHSVMDTARVAAEVLGGPWENYEIVWGSTGNSLPWSSQQDASQTTHAHTRANYAAALDAKGKLQEIAAKDLGGTPDLYDVGNGRVFHRQNPSQSLTFARAAQRAIAIGGKFDGHDVSSELHPTTVASAATLAGQGLMGVAKDKFPHDGEVFSFIAAFAEVEVDTDTGEHRVIEYLPVADVGTVLHPRSLGAQLHGGAIQGFGHARTQNIVYEPRYGKLLSRRFYQNKPPTILDIPLVMQWEALNIPEPSNPVGAKGVGEVSALAGSAAVLCAIQNAIGSRAVLRTPVTPNRVLDAIAAEAATPALLTAYA